MGFGLFELAIVLFVVFLILGPRRIQGLFQALGRSVRDFKLEFGKEEDGRDERELPPAGRRDERE